MRAECAGAKSKIRNPKAEGRKKAETRRPNMLVRPWASDFGIRTSFGLRSSDFGFLSSSFFAPNGSMSRILSLEISEARPIEPFAQIHFGHSHRAPILCLREHTPFA